jgi:class 3 adenylate cyclase
VTNIDDEVEVVEKIVVCFDICSSSAILEDLLATENLQVFRNLLISIKDYIRHHSEISGLRRYKFIGDGWILLIPPETKGSALVDFLTSLSRRFSEEIQKLVVPRLQSTPEIMGLTFGVDKGRLIRFQMVGRTEYIGRPLNVASRLQGAIKDRDHRPAYKVLFSKHTYNALAIPRSSGKVEQVKRSLRNIQGGRPLEFIKLKLPM